MKTITGKVSFLFLNATIHDFYRHMDRHNCEVVKVKRDVLSYTITVRGKDSNLDMARWYFTYGTIL